ncbi:MAG: TonB-dependent receptor [Nevskia sp.]|nr:TonB-dependent receptor [Nevskia sp.]
MSLRWVWVPEAKRRGGSSAAAMILLLAVSPTAFCAADNPAAVFELPEVNAVATAPLPGIGLPLQQVPGNIQTLSGKQIGAQRPLDATDLLNRNLGSVNINDTQGSPFQPDVNFRGFTASPVLGTPQGLSVFVDGVRVNEVFADTVNWDLIPESAIANLTLVPAANPAFGLGSMGGALAVNTKSGFQFPGTSVSAYGGSFARRDLEFESGGHGERLDYFISGNAFQESGWADHNPGKVLQFFGKTGYQDERTDLDLSYTYADTHLGGNQTIPTSWLDTPTQTYSWPDYQDDRMHFVNLKASHYLADDLLLAGDVHERLVNTGIFNSNVNDNFDPTLPVGAGNQPTGNAINHIQQSRPGGSLQLNWLPTVAGHKNDLTAGLNYEFGATRFSQYYQEAGSSRDTGSTAPATLQVKLHTATRDTGVYLTDNFQVDRRTFLTLSGRYDDATEDLEDQLGTALNGHHRFVRFNPAAGLTYNPTPRLTGYVSYGEGTRVPTPIELSCADPNAPCSLPNGFSGDPDLKPVVSKTWEAGVRGRWGRGTSWNASLFRTRLQDDIQFISSGGGSTSAGYFRNVGKTRRQGAELGAESTLGRLSLSAHYSLVLATFETPLILSSPDNSSAAPITCPACADIRVMPGNRIPGVPRHNFKLRGEYAFTKAFSVALDAQAQTSQFARGDENNLDVNGPVPGYVLVNANARYDFAGHWRLFGKIDNLLDSRYYTFGLLSQDVFTAPGRTFDPTGASWRSEQFRTVGTPIGGWLGVEYDFGDKG